MLQDGVADYGPLEIQKLGVEYLEAHQHHKRFRGGLSKPSVEFLATLVGAHHAASILDYGSGKGRQYVQSDAHSPARQQHLPWGVVPVCYDPGVPGLLVKPTYKFDGVICTDVAEHIPESCIDWFLIDVLSYVGKFAFMSIACDPSRKTLPSGTNTHLTVKEPMWWRERIVAALRVLHPDYTFDISPTDKVEGYHWLSQRFELVVLFTRNLRLKGV
jgi:hypothetical protein